MSLPAGNVNTWEQLSLVPDELLEFTLRVGIQYGSDHCQVQMEMMNPSTGVLVAMRSWPHIDLMSAADRLDEILLEVAGVLRGLCEPF